MKTLIITPIESEIRYFLQSCAEAGKLAESLRIGKLTVTHFPELEILVAQGGLGKTQFAVQTQHLIEQCPTVQQVICAGTAGSLVDHLSVGDVVVATETVEHDIHNHMGKPILPKFRSDQKLVGGFRTLPAANRSFALHFAPIASGDEDVVDGARRQAVQTLTDAWVVAWEGAGGARACQFSGLPFVEIRGVTDGANHTAASDFKQNIQHAMRNVANLIIDWATLDRSVILSTTV